MVKLSKNESTSVFGFRCTWISAKSGSIPIVAITVNRATYTKSLLNTAYQTWSCVRVSCSLCCSLNFVEHLENVAEKQEGNKNSTQKHTDQRGSKWAFYAAGTASANAFITMLLLSLYFSHNRQVDLALWPKYIHAHYQLLCSIFLYVYCIYSRD